jgi:uncharacterized protein with PQ loop repeat
MPSVPGFIVISQLIQMFYHRKSRYTDAISLSLFICSFYGAFWTAHFSFGGCLVAVLGAQLFCSSLPLSFAASPIISAADIVRLLHLKVKFMDPLYASSWIKNNANKSSTFGVTNIKFYVMECNLLWIFCAPVFVVLCVHMSVQIKFNLVWKNCQLLIKFAIVKWLNVLGTEIKACYLIVCRLDNIHKGTLYAPSVLSRKSSFTG